MLPKGKRNINKVGAGKGEQYEVIYMITVCVLPAPGDLRVKYTRKKISYLTSTFDLPRSLTRQKEVSISW